MITSTAIDDDWPAGYAGVHRGVQTAAAEQFDSFKVGYDNNADADIDDAGDDVQVDDNFDSAAISLSYDNNGNLTEDGVFKYVYDAWNRLVIVKRIPDATTTIATYAYDGLKAKGGGDGIGKTKAGKGVKIMVLVDARGLPVAIDT